MTDSYERRAFTSDPADPLMHAVRAATAQSHEILGVLGRDAGGASGVAYLARRRDSGELAVLTLDRAPGDTRAGEPLALSERRQLDASVPSPGGSCEFCHAALVGWERYCRACGSDVSGTSPGTAAGTSSEQVEATVREAAGDSCEILGDMPRAEGGGRVFFGRDRQSGVLVALRPLHEQPAPSAAPPAPPGVSQLFAPADGGEIAPATPQESAPGGKICPQCGVSYGMDVRFCPDDGVALRVVAAGASLVGQILAERYHIERKLGEGGMGEVYLGTHVKMGRPCAIKIMHPALTHDPDATGRFGREAANASRINHPNVAIVYDFGETADGIVYIAMEYVDGEPLSAVIAREGPLAEDRVLDIGAQVAQALAAAHELGIVHRDLKPDNIMLVRKDDRDLVKVVDFGIAKAMRNTSTRITRTGFVLGTPAYMSPEQVSGDVLDGRTDLYSLGCILFELLTGYTTFSGPSAEAIITRRLTEPPPHPRMLNGTVSEPLDEIVVRALARAPGDRFQSAAEFAQALVDRRLPSAVRSATETPSRSAGTEHPPASASATVAQGTTMPAARRRPVRTMWYGIGAAVVVGVAIAALTWQRAQRETARERVANGASTVALSSGVQAAATHADSSAQDTAAVDLAATKSAAGDSVASDAPTASVAATPTVPAGARSSKRAGDTSSSTVIPPRGAGNGASPAQPVPRRSRAASVPRRAGNADAALKGDAQVAGSPAATQAGHDSAVGASPPHAPPPAAAATAPAQPPATDASAQTARITSVLQRYVAALGARQITIMRELYPGMPDREREGFAALFAHATDLSATPTGTPTVTLDGATATADFGYTLSFFLPAQGQQTSPFRWHAALRQTADGWRITTLTRVK
ncbi:MAG TPA: protein kinase [Gemmatimonadaceae bacterium]|nr:protein kinase [Gemmatimonadaceae bacterium]